MPLSRCCVRSAKTRLACELHSDAIRPNRLDLSMPFPELHPNLLRALTAREYNEPTPVQEAVLRPEAADRDLLVSAQTGSGKTVAYGLALASMLLGTAERFPETRPPLALIVAPTRELALQVCSELEWLFA